MAQDVADEVLAVHPLWAIFDGPQFGDWSAVHGDAERFTASDSIQQRTRLVAKIS